MQKGFVYSALLEEDPDLEGIRRAAEFRRLAVMVKRSKRSNESEGVE